MCNSPSRFTFSTLLRGAVLATAGGLLTACATSSGDALEPVRVTASARLGKQLPLGCPEAEHRVEELLRKPLTEDRAVEIALLHNPHLWASLQEVGVAEADLLAARTPANPRLATGYRLPTGGGSPDVEFGLAGDFIDWLAIPLKSRMAERELRKTQCRVTHEVLELAANVKAACYQAQAQAQLHHKLQSIAAVNAASADLAGRVHEAGNISDLDLLTQQTGSLQSQSDVKRSLGERAAARVKLNRLLGLSGVAGNWTLAGDLPAPPSSDPALGTAQELALAQRQDLAALREHVAAEEAALRLKRGTRLLPALNLGVDTERQTDGPRITGPTLDVELPLLNWGAAGVRKLEAQVRQAQAEEAALEADVRNDVEAAHAALRSARDVYAFQDHTLLPQRSKILEETLLHYNAMQKSPFELLMAKQEQQRAERERIEALRDYWIARAELERAAGGSLRRSPSKTSPAPASKN